MKKIILISSILFSMIISPIAFAEGETNGTNGSGGTFNACKHVVSGKTAVCSGDSKNATNIAKNIISILLWVVGIAAVIVIIYAGITFITAAGNPSAITRAKTMIIYAVIGLAVAILSYAIVNFVINTSSGKGVGGGSSGSSGTPGESNNSSGSTNTGSQSKNQNGENNSGQSSSGSNSSNNN